MMKRKTKKLISNIAIVAVMVCGAAWIASTFIHVGGEFTNNAQVAQDIVRVTARVQGFVSRIYVDEYQHVEQGDTLLTIEDSEFVLHLRQAEAALQSAMTGKNVSRIGAQNARNQVGVTDASLAEIQVLLRNAEADEQRYRALYEQGAVTQQQFDAVETQYQSLKAKAETMRRQRIGSGIAHDETGLRVEQQDAAIAVAEAALRLAQLNLDYCTVLAPCSGQTARRMVQEGELAMPGRHLFTIVSDRSRWVVANFRETQFGSIRVGSPVSIKVDALDGHAFDGVVAAIASATGAQYSPVAPDNATGNFVKVEQRIPVKIVFTADNDSALLRQLSAGMNAECTVTR